MNRQTIVKYILLLLIFGISMTVSLWGIKWFLEHSNESLYKKSAASLVVSVLPPQLPSDSDEISEDLSLQPDQISIDSESFVAVSVANRQEKIIVSKNEEEQLPVASLTKLMTALVVLENYDLHTKVTVSQAAMDQEGVQGVSELGEVFSVKDLLYVTLIESSNRAAYALSEVMGNREFIAKMNTEAKKVGLANTYFADVAGLDAASHSSARDIAALSAYLFDQYPLFREIINTKEFDLYLEDGQFHHRLENTNEFLGKVPGIVGGKTGWISASRGCFMAIQKTEGSDHYTVYVILGAEDRFLEMKKLINWVSYNYQ